MFYISRLDLWLNFDYVISVRKQGSKFLCSMVNGEVYFLNYHEYCDLLLYLGVVEFDG